MVAGEPCQDGAPGRVPKGGKEPVQALSLMVHRTVNYQGPDLRCQAEPRAARCSDARCSSAPGKKRDAIGTAPRITETIKPAFSGPPLSNEIARDGRIPLPLCHDLSIVAGRQGAGEIEVILVTAHLSPGID